MAHATSLKDLFVETLRRAYDTEKRLAKALLDMRNAATSEDLQHAFQMHQEETVVHADRLDEIFAWFDEKPKALTCEAVKGLLDDSKHVLKLDADADTRDAALIAAAQGVEHFEIALYGTLRTWAVVLEKKKAMEVLEVTLEEEKAADALLTSIAGTLNLRAAHVK
jgi:ferritin-like metal-binding protein YciE